MRCSFFKNNYNVELKGSDGMQTCDTIYGVKACDGSQCNNCPLQKDDYYKEGADVPDEDL